FQRELNQPGVHRRRGYLAKSGQAVCSSRSAELRVIEQIEKLRPKLEPRVFMESANLRRFGQGCIEIELTRAKNRPDSGIAKSCPVTKGRNVAEGGLIEVALSARRSAWLAARGAGRCPVVMSDS